MERPYQPYTTTAFDLAWKSETARQATPNTAPAIQHWWANFNDPALGRLFDALVSRNLSLAAARERVIEARARRGIVDADRLPSINTTGSYDHAGTGKEGFSFQGPPPGGEASIYSAGLSAAWEIDLWGRVAQEVRSAQASIDFSVEDYRDAAVALRAELANDYFQWRALVKRSQLVSRNIELQRRTLKIIESLERAGRSTQLDVEQSRRLLAQTVARLPDLDFQRVQTENAIAVLLGRTPAALQADGLLASGPVGDDFTVVPHLPEAIGQGLPADLLERRADIRRAERAYASAYYEADAARLERYPKVSISGTFSLQGTDAGSVVNPRAFSYGLGPNISWPLFDGGRIEANRRVQVSRAEQARLQYQETVLRAVAETETSARGVIATRQRVADLHNAQTAAEKTARLADQLFQNGIRDVLQLIDAQRELVSVQDDVATAEQASAVQTIQLYRALGGDWESISLRSPTRPAVVKSASESQP